MFKRLGTLDIWVAIYDVVASIEHMFQRLGKVDTINNVETRCC